MPEVSDTLSEHERDCCKIRVLSTDWQVKAKSHQIFKGRISFEVHHSDENQMMVLKGMIFNEIITIQE
jgi:hypothetical protein